MITNALSSLSAGTTLYEARMFRRRNGLYLWLKSPLLEAHFKRLAPAYLLHHSRWTLVDPTTYRSNDHAPSVYHVAPLVGEYGLRTPLGSITYGPTVSIRPTLAVFLTEHLSTGVCYQVDAMLSSAAAVSYLERLRDAVRPYIETALAPLDISMTVALNQEVA